MSFVHYEFINDILSRGDRIDFSTVFKIGDTVDTKTIALLAEGDYHIYYGVAQESEVFCYVDNDLGERLPCYITFSRDNNLWVFRGACYANSIINRCGGFDYVPQTIGDYCVEKFNTAYIKALSSMYSKDNSHTDVDDYINRNALTAAGYLIALYGDKVLKVFEEKGTELCREELYNSVAEILKHKDDIYNGESLNVLKKN